MIVMMTITIGVLRMISKGLVNGLEESEIRGPAETIKTTALLRLARILRRVLEIWGDLLLLTPVKDYQLMVVWKILHIIKWFHVP